MSDIPQCHDEQPIRRKQTHLFNEIVLYTIYSELSIESSLTPPIYSNILSLPWTQYRGQHYVSITLCTRYYNETNIYIESGVYGSVGQPKAIVYSKSKVPGSTPDSSSFYLVFIKNL